MPRETDREKWSRIQGDEAAALRKQQQDAGSSHAPVLGPGPYGAHDTNMAVEESVAAERDRCAQLVELEAEKQPEHISSLLKELAVRIRAG